MSNMLRTPSLGPIVGHTTTTTVRVWMRGSDETDGRTVGVAVLCDAKGRPKKDTAQYVRLHREHDRTGTVDFDGLEAGTAYSVRLGSLTLDSTDDMEHVETDDLEEKLPAAAAWIDELKALPEEESLAEFTTFPADEGAGLSFIFGSCRYPGLLWAAKKADRIYGSILQKFQAGGDAPPRFLLMVGDQIYADKMNRAIPLGRADSPSEFHERYVTAFGSPNMRHLLRTVPTYMILDDHEIEDNWVQGRIKNHDKRNLFQTAISAYMSYQWIHSPRNFDKNGPAEDENQGRRLFYSFECGGYPFFVMDSRTQRIRDDDDYVTEDNHLLGYPSKPTAPGYQGQINILCDWLVEQQKKNGNRPKFIVSPSVFVPNGIETAGAPDDQKANRKKCEDDSWAAFPVTRRQLLQTIVRENIQNVIFLSGDVHCSNLATISFVDKNKGTLPLRAYSITSSAFYWPWTFADGDPLSFVHDSAGEGDNFSINDDNDDLVMTYRASQFEQEDNYTQVDVQPGKIVTQNFDSEGHPLGTPTELSLA